jgi:hypothetical protein
MVLSPRSRWLLSGALLLAVTFGAWLSTGQLRLTALNASLRLDYPWGRGLGAMLAAAAFALLARVAPNTWLRVMSGTLGVITLAVAGYLLTYRLESTEGGIASRSFFVRSTIPWREVVHVGAEPTLVVVSGTGQRKIAIDTTDILPEHRLVLSRNITRHVNEVSARAARP